MSYVKQQLLEIAPSVIGYRDSKGFAAATWEDLPTKIACIFCEIEELEAALDAYADNRGSPYATGRSVWRETADVAMYALTILQDVYEGEWTMREVYHGGPRALAAPAELTKPLRREARGAFEHWRKGEKKDVKIRLELLLAALIDMRGRVLGRSVSLAEDIAEKIAFAKDRPVLHGGKDPRS